MKLQPLIALWSLCVLCASAHSRRTPHEYVHGVPIYNADAAQLASDGSNRTWNIILKATSDDAIVNTLCSGPSGDIACLSKGHPSAGGVAFITLQASEQGLERFVGEHREAMDFIEPDFQIFVPPHEVHTEQVSEDDLPKAKFNSPPWGLDRIDSRKGLDSTYSPFADGEGVHVYVFDTGIRASHADFGGRVVPTLDASNGRRNVCDSSDQRCTQDTQGHGTHCAGTVGGARMGVAKRATIHAVKVVNDRGQGLIQWVVNAIDWVAANAVRPAVVSMSLGGPLMSEVYTRAVDAAVAAGIPVVVASGNENKDACRYAPAGIQSAITVGGSDKQDDRTKFKIPPAGYPGGSNYGRCVDIFAPGSDILAASHENDRSFVEMTGTSMAAPHVAGAVAMYLQMNPRMKPADIARALREKATKGEITDAKGSPNLFLYVKDGPGGRPPPRPTPAPPYRPPPAPPYRPPPAPPYRPPPAPSTRRRGPSRRRRRRRQSGSRRRNSRRRTRRRRRRTPAPPYRPPPAPTPKPTPKPGRGGKR